MPPRCEAANCAIAALRRQRPRRRGCSASQPLCVVAVEVAPEHPHHHPAQDRLAPSLRVTAPRYSAEAICRSSAGNESPCTHEGATGCGSGGVRLGTDGFSTDTPLGFICSSSQHCSRDTPDEANLRALAPTGIQQRNKNRRSAFGDQGVVRPRVKER